MKNCKDKLFNVTNLQKRTKSEDGFQFKTNLQIIYSEIILEGFVFSSHVLPKL